MNNFFSTAMYLTLFVFLISCNVRDNNHGSYYSIDSLVHAQVVYLTKSKAVLTKKAEIDGKEEAVSFTPTDTTSWANELAIFSALAEINKPINAGRYTIENGVRDPNSNLLIRSFISTSVLPVVYLKLFYLDGSSLLRRVEALYREENTLLKGSRLLLMEFQQINNEAILTSYSIEGSQKMLLSDPVQFSIKGTVTLQ